MASKSEPSLIPVLSLLIAATLWGIFWYPLRLLEDQGLQGIWVTLVIYLAPLLVFGGFLAKAHWRAVPLRSVNLLLFTLAAGWCNVSFILAILEGSVMRVLLLFYLSPIWAILLSRVMLGERLSRHTVAVLVAAMVGALTMLWHPEVGFPWPQDGTDWLAISSGMSFAYSNVLARKLSQVPVAIKTVGNWTGVVLVAGVWILYFQVPVPVAAGSAWGFAVLLGLVMLVIMTYTVMVGVSRLPVSKSAIILLFELVVGAISAQLLSDERMLPREWLGGLLIVLAAYAAAKAPSVVGEPKGQRCSG